MPGGPSSCLLLSRKGIEKPCMNCILFWAICLDMYGLLASQESHSRLASGLRRLLFEGKGGEGKQFFKNKSCRLKGISACSLIGIPASIDQTMCCKKCNNADLQCQMRSTRGLTEKDSCFRTFVLSIREQAAQPACPALANAGHRIQNSSATDCSNRIALLKAIQLWRHMKDCTFCGTSRGMHNLLHVVPSIRLQQPRRMHGRASV